MNDCGNGAAFSYRAVLYARHIRLATREKLMGWTPSNGIFFFSAFRVLFRAFQKVSNFDPD